MIPRGILKGPFPLPSQDEPSCCHTVHVKRYIYYKVEQRVIKSQIFKDIVTIFKCKRFFQPPWWMYETVAAPLIQRRCTYQATRGSPEAACCSIFFGQFSVALCEPISMRIMFFLKPQYVKWAQYNLCSLSCLIVVIHADFSSLEQRTYTGECTMSQRARKSNLVLINRHSNKKKDIIYFIQIFCSLCNVEIQGLSSYN